MTYHCQRRKKQRDEAATLRVGARGFARDTARGQRTEVCAVELVAVWAKIGVPNGVEKDDVCEGDGHRGYERQRQKDVPELMAGMRRWSERA